MPYTLLLRGQLLGETDFEREGPGRTQRLGLFRPTDAGRGALPKLTGLLSALFGLKRAMEHRGVSTEDPEPDEVVEVMRDTSEGQRVIEHAEMLEALELRDPKGNRLTFASIAVSDVAELRRIAREFGDGADVVGGLVEPWETGPYLISATFAGDSKVGSHHRRTQPGWRRRT